MDQVRTERLKLFANYLNIVAAGSMVAAVVTEPFTLAAGGRPDFLAKLPFILGSFVIIFDFSRNRASCFGKAGSMTRQILEMLFAPALATLIAVGGYAIIVLTDPHRKERRRGR